LESWRGLPHDLESNHRADCAPRRCRTCRRHGRDRNALLRIMIEQLKAVAERCDLTIPAAHRLPVAFVGAGGIVAAAHLPAYRKAGLEIVGVYDKDIARARAFARQHAI